jgi:glycosyltransferase involved in cell wall biosynthesis
MNAASPGRRVLILSWRDEAHPEAGGSERTIGVTARGLAGRGYEVTLFTARYPGSPKTSVEGGVRIVRRGGRLSVHPRGLLYSLRHRADHVLDVQNGVPFLAAAAAGARGVLLVHHVHREQWPLSTGPIASRIGWWIESRLSPLVHRHRRVVAMSHATRAELVGLGHPDRTISVVLNGVDPPPPDLPRWSGAPRLVTLSRLVPPKRVEHAIEILDHILDDRPDATLTIIGDGYARAELEQLVAARGLADKVHFAGHVSDAEKFALLATAAVHLLPSIKEGWGLAAVEAASVGVPTVAYRSAGGVRYSVLDGRTGFLASDLDDMERVTRMLLSDGTVRASMTAQCRVYARSLLWDTTVDGIEQVLLGQPAPAAAALSEELR